MKQLLITLTLLAGTAYSAAPADNEKNQKTVGSKPMVATTTTTATNVVSSNVETPLKYPAVPGEAHINFDRHLMSPLDTERENYLHKEKDWLVEGYWRGSENDTSSLERQYPFPKAGKPWAGKDDFLAKLWLLEYKSEYSSDRLNRPITTGIELHGSKLPAPSRIDNTWVSSFTFTDHDHHIRWPDGYKNHYVDQYNVLPSLQFFRYVHARAADFGATTGAEALKIKANVEAAIDSKEKADALLPWNQQATQDAMIAKMLGLYAPYLKSRRCPPAENAIINQKSLEICPELTGANSREWANALLDRIHNMPPQDYLGFVQMMLFDLIKKQSDK